jgi:hypothetical protein
MYCVGMTIKCNYFCNPVEQYKSLRTTPYLTLDFNKKPLSRNTYIRTVVMKADKDVGLLCKLFLIAINLALTLLPSSKHIFWASRCTELTRTLRPNTIGGQDKRKAVISTSFLFCKPTSPVYRHCIYYMLHASSSMLNNMNNTFSGCVSRFLAQQAPSKMYLYYTLLSLLMILLAKPSSHLDLLHSPPLKRNGFNKAAPNPSHISKFTARASE